MNARPIILVSQRVVVDSSTGEARDALAHDWTAWAESLDVSFVPVPNSLSDPASWAAALDPRALILSGGNDLAPAPARDSRARDLSPTLQRELTETRLLDWAVATRLPTLGVCRGMQFINRHFGGGITRDINVSTAAFSHVRTRHAIRLDARYAPVEIAGNESVNSFHDQGVRQRDLAPDLRAFAFADDDFIEGVVHPDYPFTGVQWHPERDPTHAWSAPLLRRLLSNTSAHARRRTA